MSKHLPFPLPEAGQHSTQVGRRDGKVIVAFDERPVMALSPEQALTFASLIIKHIAGIMGERAMVENAMGIIDKDKPDPSAALDKPPPQA